VDNLIFSVSNSHDCYVDCASNEDIVREFIQTNWLYERLSLRADIERLLYLRAEDLFDAMKSFFLCVFIQNLIRRACSGGSLQPWHN
jgi:hypothetical protein